MQLVRIIVIKIVINYRSNFSGPTLVSGNLNAFGIFPNTDKVNDLMLAREFCFKRY